MTFKHVKFEDSVVMRSLEKLAKEKGLVKEEPITKTASQKVAPSANLTENVLNLCAGLRDRGFHKAASELESKYMTLKHAQTLYETSSEKGEDLIDAAHPKGSHKLEDVDGDEATFETILDQHLKNMKVVDKDPTGKLASNREIFKAVKQVLGQASTADIIKGLVSQAQGKFNELLGFLKGPGNATTSSQGRLMAVAPLTRVWSNAAGGPTAATVKQGLATIANCKTNLSYIDPNENKKLDDAWKANSISDSDKSRYLLSIQSYTDWQGAERCLNELTTLLNQMAQNLTAGDAPLLAKFDAQINRLNTTFRSLLRDPGFTDQDRKEGNAEIDGYIKTLKAWRGVVAGADAGDKAEISAQYEKKLNELIPSINKLYSEITGTGG